MTTLSFADFELKNKMFDYKINDRLIWKYIRFNLYELISNRSHIKEIKTHRNIFGVFRLLTGYIKYTRSFKNYSKKDILFLSHPRKIRQGEKYQDIYLDLLIKNHKDSSIVIDIPQVINNKVIHYETDYENIVYNDGLYIINIFSRIFKSVILQEKRIRKSKDFIKLVDMINNNFNTYHNIEHIKDLIINAYFKIDIYRKFYKRILTKVNPKIIIEVISYSFDSIIINELACEKNMKIVEVQHGTILSHHIGYQYDFKHYDFHPTHILLFGDYWKKNIKISQNYTKLISVGFPYLEKRRLEITSNYTKNNTILFISQLEVGKAFYDFAILLLQSEISKKINIIFKLHNEEFSCWKNIYPKLVSSQILVIDNNDSDIYNYLSIAKTIIVGKSTVLYEALMYDADILSYNITFDPDLDYIEKNNITKSVKTFEDIYSQIYYNLDNRNKNERCIDKSIFWEINSRNKQLDIINEIIGE